MVISGPNQYLPDCDLILLKKSQTHAKHLMPSQLPRQPLIEQHEFSPFQRSASGEFGMALPSPEEESKVALGLLLAEPKEEWD